MGFLFVHSIQYEEGGLIRDAKRFLCNEVIGKGLSRQVSLAASACIAWWASRSFLQEDCKGQSNFFL